MAVLSDARGNPRRLAERRVYRGPSCDPHRCPLCKSVFSSRSNMVRHCGEFHKIRGKTQGLVDHLTAQSVPAANRRLRSSAVLYWNNDASSHSRCNHTTKGDRSRALHKIERHFPVDAIKMYDVIVVAECTSIEARTYIRDQGFAQFSCEKERRNASRDGDEVSVFVRRDAYPDAKEVHRDTRWVTVELTPGGARVTGVHLHHKKKSGDYPSLKEHGMPNDRRWCVVGDFNATEQDLVRWLPQAACQLPGGVPAGSRVIDHVLVDQRSMTGSTLEAIKTVHGRPVAECFSHPVYRVTF